MDMAILRLSIARLRVRQIAPIEVGKALELGIAGIVVQEIGPDLSDPSVPHDVPLATSHHDAPIGVLRRPDAAPFADHVIPSSDDLVDGPNGIQQLLELAPVPRQMFG